ncbi:uncharacterized protein ACIBXB_006634 isoform 2-T2 [Morphnus guianensis]
MSCCSYWHILSNPIPQYDCITNKARKATTKFKDRTEDEQGKKIPVTKQTKKGHTFSAVGRAACRPRRAFLEEPPGRDGRVSACAIAERVAGTTRLRCRGLLGFPPPTCLQHMSPHCHIEVAQQPEDIKRRY